METGEWRQENRDRRMETGEWRLENVDSNSPLAKGVRGIAITNNFYISRVNIPLGEEG
jgi:hypothetical protein